MISRLPACGLVALSILACSYIACGSSDPDLKDENPVDSGATNDSNVNPGDVVDAGALDPDASDSGAPVTQAELSTACLEGNTRNFLHCNGNVVKAAVVEGFRTSCEARAAKSFLVGITDEYRAALKACEDSRGSFCSGFSPACQSLSSLFGTLSSGTACQDSAQCSSGLCFGATATVCGACAPPLPAGGDCTGANSKRCAMNAGCDNGKCTPYVMTEVGAECSYSRPCREGNTCSIAQPDSGVSYQCKPDRTAGQSCDPALGEVCASAGTSMCVGSCTPRPIEGGTCDAKQACRSGFVCDAGICRKGKVDLAIGSLCKANADACIAGASCYKYDSVAKTYSCVAKAKFDESCGPGVAECAAPLVCDTATLLCRQPSTLACP